MRGILFSQMEPPEEGEADFLRWYDTDHIPRRLALPGFEAATRYRAVEGEPKFLAVYELSDMGVLETPEYEAIKKDPSAERMLSHAKITTCCACEEISDSGDPGRRGGYLAVVAFTVPSEDLGQFDDWYETEHAPMLLKAGDWLRVRRYRAAPGEDGGWNQFALHELASLEVMASPERAAARKGPKREALLDRPWYNRSGRWQYQVIGRD